MNMCFTIIQLYFPSAIILGELLCLPLLCTGFFVTIWIAVVMFKFNDMLPNQTALKISGCFVKRLVYSFTNIYAARILRSEKHLV